MDSLELQRELCRVRNLRPTDLNRVVELDALITGRERRGYYANKLDVNLLDSSVTISLGAESDGRLVGFLLARVWTGEFGMTEPTAVLDTIGVHPDFQHHGVGDALVEQLLMNLRGLQVSTLRTELAWNEFALLRFFHHHGFHPAQRVCLDLNLMR